MSKKANEPQNQVQFDNYYQKGGVVLGPYSTHIANHDPKHLVFLLSRYKFCGKMLEGKAKVLEVGCGDSFGTAITLQTVSSVLCIDIEPLVIEDNKNRKLYDGRATFAVHDITTGPAGTGRFDAAYSLDVIEHIPADREHLYFENICKSLVDDGIFIMGTPNITSNQYASEGSRLGHINLKSHVTMREGMGRFFKNVFIFSMNDEVVHTGFGPMANYLLGVGVGVKR